MIMHSQNYLILEINMPEILDLFWKKQVTSEHYLGWRITKLVSSFPGCFAFIVLEFTDQFWTVGYNWAKGPP